MGTTVMVKLTKMWKNKSLSTVTILRLMKVLVLSGPVEGVGYLGCCLGPRALRGPRARHKKIVRH